MMNTKRGGQVAEPAGLVKSAQSPAAVPPSVS